MYSASKFEGHVKKLKDHKIEILILAAIIILAVVLRVYHLDYPTVGYHNIKEGESLSFAYNMYEDKDPFTTRWFDCGWSGNKFTDPNDKCFFNESESPLVSWMIIFFWLIFGVKLWAARLVIVILSVLTIIPLYLLVKRITSKTYLAMLSCLFFAVMPVAVFFGRNVQPDAASLFFGLIALNYYYKLLREEHSPRNLLLGNIFIVIAALFKVTILLLPIALIFFIPFKQLIRYLKDSRKFQILKEGIAPFAVFLAIPLWLIISKILMPSTTSSNFSTWITSFVDLKFHIFTSAYWSSYYNILSSYVRDDYSFIVFYLAIIGVAIMLFKIRSNIAKLLLGYTLAYIVYMTLFAFKVNAHSYYQMPFAPLFAIACANVFFQLGSVLNSIFKKEFVKYIPLVFILLLWVPVNKSIHINYDTQFFGHDVAGEYIQSVTPKNEFFIYEKGNQNDLSWHAKRFHYSMPSNLSGLLELEKDKNIRYIVLNGYAIYQVQQNKEVWDHISANYRIEQVGLISTGQGYNIQYLIFRKSNSPINISELNNYAPIFVKNYQASYGDVGFYKLQVPYVS